jgi:AraC family transcriptional regulator
VLLAESINPRHPFRSKELRGGQLTFDCTQRLSRVIHAGITPYNIIGQRSTGNLRVTHFTQAAKSGVARHHHENATLCVVLRGMARDQFRHRAIEYEPGAVIYRPPGEGHSHQFGKDGLVAIVIEIPESYLCADSTLHFLSELRFEPNAPTLGDSAQLLACLRNSATAEADVEEHCLSLLSVFNRNRERASTSDGVERVRTRLDECFMEGHSLAELGKIAGLHPSYLVNAFRERFGCSIGQYRRRRRVTRAIRQIWNTQAALSDIALETGFYDQSHCTNELRKDLRLTPNQIRKMMSVDL